MEVDSVGIIAILSMSYINTRIVKTWTSVAKIPRVPVENQITTLSVVKIATKFSPCRWRLKLDVEFFLYLFLIRKSFVINDWNKVEGINYLKIRKKIVLAFVFREISSIIYTLWFCCELQRCRESPTWIFLLCFSTNRHIWRIVKLSCKFQKFSNFANSDFSVFLDESAHLVTFGTI